MGGQVITECNLSLGSSLKIYENVRLNRERKPTYFQEIIERTKIHQLALKFSRIKADHCKLFAHGGGDRRPVFCTVQNCGESPRGR